jgi:hypothetical protein
METVPPGFAACDHGSPSSHWRLVLPLAWPSPDELTASRVPRGGSPCLTPSSTGSAASSRHSILRHVSEISVTERWMSPRPDIPRELRMQRSSLMFLRRSSMPATIQPMSGDIDPTKRETVHYVHRLRWRLLWLAGAIAHCLTLWLALARFIRRLDFLMRPSKKSRPEGRPRCRIVHHPNGGEKRTRPGCRACPSSSKALPAGETAAGSEISTADTAYVKTEPRDCLPCANLRGGFALTAKTTGSGDSAPGAILHLLKSIC